MRLSAAVGRFVVLTLTFSAVAWTQEQPKPFPDAPVPKQDVSPQKHENALQGTVSILGRRSLFFPDLAASKGPLSTGQKFELSAGVSIAPYHLLGAGVGAGISQARNAWPGYGQEIGGYGKRFGAAMATSATDSFLGKFVLASLLRRDPRYFVLLRGGPVRRVGYALSRLAVDRTDEGARATNWPGLISPVLAESLANSYLPAGEQTAARTFQRYGIRLGLAGAANIAREYWPTIFRSLRIAKIAPGMNPAPSGP
jgi:hypothetical protein